MNKKEEKIYFSFLVDKLNIAIPIEYILRTLPLVELKYLPNLPESIIGLLNYQGEIYPVFDVRNLYDHENKPLSINDHIVIGEKNNFKFGIIATEIIGNIIPDEHEIEKTTEPDKILFRDKYIKMENELIYLSDPENFLLLDEKNRLQNILENHDN